MSTITEKSAQDLAVSFINALDTLSKDRNSGEGTCNTYSSDDFIPDGFYDGDLLEIQAMSDDEVASELAELGYDDSTIAKNVEVCTSGKVVKFPDPRIKQDKIEAKLQSTLMTALIQEALLKKASLTKERDTAEYSQKVVDIYTGIQQETDSNVIPIMTENNSFEQSKSIDDTKRKLLLYKRAFAVAASLFVLVTCFSVIPSLIEQKEKQVIVASAETREVVDTEDINPGPQKTHFNTSDNSPTAMPAFFRVVSKNTTPEVTLQYETTMVFLNKIDSGEIEASTVEKLRIAHKLREVASADSLLVQQQGLDYQTSKTCAAIGKYEYVVMPGDTLSAIINRCAYEVGDSSFFKTDQVLKIDDIIIMDINKRRMITRIDIDRENQPLLTIYRHEKR